MPKFRQEKKYVNLTFDFIEKFIPAANHAYLTVYIYLLRLAQDNIEADYGKIADRLNLLESDVVNAVNYWQKMGVLSAQGDYLVFNETSDNAGALQTDTSITSPDVSKQNNETAAAINNKETKETYNENKHYDNIQVSNDIQSDELLADMLEKAQEFLGKPLNTNEIHTLYSMYEQLRLPPQVIVLLIEYCVSGGKTNMNYIEKIAMSWNEKGIDTIEKALDFFAMEQSKNDLMSELRKMFQLYDRNFTELEEDIIMNWINSYGTDVELMKYAYELTVMNTGKFSVRYMDGIIKRWFENNITDINAAKAEAGRFRQNRQSKGSYETYQNDTYDYNDIENRVWNTKK